MKRSRRFQHNDLFVSDPSRSAMVSGGRVRRDRFGVKLLLLHAHWRQKHGISCVDLPHVVGSAPTRVLECIAMQLESMRRQGDDLTTATLYADGGQNIHRMASGRDRAPCVTPNNYIYLHSPERKGFLTGVHAFAYQGLDLDDFPAWREFDDSRLRDLAGNSFSMTVFLCVLLSVLAHVTCW